jgi:DMSO/TMAO reductase YedYZ molybdopterin-dependent catalytic subunit
MKEAMNRRELIAFWGGAFLLRAMGLRAEHHVVSANPLEVVFDLDSLVGRYTRVEDFYVRNHNETPRVTGEPLLRIEGEVANPCRITPGDLAQTEKTRLGAVLECAGNPVATNGLVSNGIWEGWPLAEVLRLAGPTQAAGFLHLFGRDGYVRSVPIDRAQHAAMLVTDLDGRPLPPNHGAPWRAFFPGWYGMDSVKWLERILVSLSPLPNKGNEYLEVRSTNSGDLTRQPLPRIEVKSVITSPAGQAVVRRGNVQLRGLAWSGEGGISKVEVSNDGGAHWREATLSPGDRYEWAMWQTTVELSQPGAAEIVCRATDSEGHTQPKQRDADRLDGYGNNWYHRVHVVVV